tara:strand:- start:133 stop:639 length:507 start_codon:yes stop_codon:yes gene_type:complete
MVILRSLGDPTIYNRHQNPEPLNMRKIAGAICGLVIEMIFIKKGWEYTGRDFDQIAICVIVGGGIGLLKLGGLERADSLKAGTTGLLFLSFISRRIPGILSKPVSLEDSVFCNFLKIMELLGNWSSGALSYKLIEKLGNCGERTRTIPSLISFPLPAGTTAHQDRKND